MDLSKFTNKTKPGATSSTQSNFIKKNFLKVKNWVLPPTSDKRK